MTVFLVDGYFVEIDPLNHTLKQAYMGKDKDGNEKQCERTIGYFRNMADCVERLAKEQMIECNSGKYMTLLEYVNEAKEEFKRIEELVQSLSEGKTARMEDE